MFLWEVDRSRWWNEGIEIQDIETTRYASEMIDIFWPASFEHPFEHPLLKKARCIQYRVMPESQSFYDDNSLVQVSIESSSGVVDIKKQF